MTNAQAQAQATMVQEHTVGNTKFITMNIDRATSRDYKEDGTMKAQVKTKTLSIDLDLSKISEDELALMKKYGVDVYTPHPTEENPTPSDFALIKFSGKTTLYDLDNMVKRVETLDANVPNFEILNATLAITRNKSQVKGQSDFTRISSIKYHGSEMTSFAVDFFGDDAQFSTIDTTAVAPTIETVEAIEG